MTARAWCTKIDSLTNETDHSRSLRTRTLLTPADELLETKNLSAPTYQQLNSEFDDHQIVVEFAMLVGHYVIAAPGSATSRVAKSGHVRTRHALTSRSCR
ncbi:hypothetical protein ABQE62_31420, partial [Mycolicibacterium fortuitum]